MFRISRHARSVTIVHGGQRRWSRKDSGDHYKYQWNLQPESNTDRLVWRGGGYGSKETIVWTRDPDTRAVQTIVFNVPTAIAKLPRKRNRSRTEHCACGDPQYNKLQEQIGCILQKKCTWKKPKGRPLNSRALAKLSASQHRKTLRSQCIQNQIVSWRQEHKLGAPAPTARFNELHFPRRLLLRMKEKKKKKHSQLHLCLASQEVESTAWTFCCW